MVVSVLTQYLGKCLTRHVEYDIHHSRFPNLVRYLSFSHVAYSVPLQVVNVLKSVFDLCQKAAVSLTASGAEVDDKTRVRGFRLLALTPSGAEPSFDEIAARATSLLLDKAYCHISPADKVYNAPSGYQ